MTTDSEHMAMDYSESAAAERKAGDTKHDKPRWPHAQAWSVAKELLETFLPACEPSYCVIAGSLRRRKETVGDIELLYIPRLQFRYDPADMFASVIANLADDVIRYLEAVRELERRKNILGRQSFGPENKLMLHRRSGIGVDLFSTLPECWWNYLVCRTGPAELNTEIARRAKARGWMWNPTGEGFSRPDGLGRESVRMNSEREVLEFVGFKYCEPWERHLLLQS